MAFRKDSEFTWKPIHNIAQDSIASPQSRNGGSVTPPPGGNNFLLLDGTDFLLLDGTNFLLL